MSFYKPRGEDRHAHGCDSTALAPCLNKNTELTEASHLWHFREAHPSEQGSDGTAHGKSKENASAGRAMIMTTGHAQVILEALCFAPKISDNNEVGHGGEGSCGVGYASREDRADNIVPNVIADNGSDICSALARSAAAPLADIGWGHLQREVRQQRTQDW